MLITYGEFQATLDKIEKINKRAEARGFTGRLAVEATVTPIKVKNDLGFEVEEIWYDVNVTGDAPHFNGWTFLATLDWDPEVGLIVRTAPGVDTVNREGLREGWCDHCKKDRNRNATYLLRHEDGRQIQVGSACIKDFLGWQGRIVLFTAKEIEEEVKDYLSGGGYIEQRWSVETVLAIAWAACQAFGYQPATSLYAVPTKTIVRTVLDPKASSRDDMELVEHLRPYVENATEQAKIIRKWILSDEFSGDNEYVWNLKTIAGGESVSFRNIGLLASAPQAWARAMERDLVRREGVKEELVNEWVGQQGDKLLLTVRVKAIRYIEGQYGVTTLYTLIGSDRHVYKWFSSNGALGDTIDDTLYEIRGTVKKHDEYRGVKSTVLTRCKVLN